MSQEETARQDNWPQRSGTPACKILEPAKRSTTENSGGASVGKDVEWDYEKHP